ncbi:capsule assembly Wzi family protein [Buttiauxella selenatireducens]|uniref:Capsule assembly Wzi family protein n=1 Tax=Buttiauxella selenatireducens TaxID=3073902 RepID=A0ABY9S8U2_9ENTR|nr:capsule assembly Wzi family protein [Buttiauxella sp. R73]WMY73813.1 capsule assembly Wzi family protein [Buttiauxella sp. R73]
MKSLTLLPFSLLGLSLFGAAIQANATGLVSGDYQLRSDLVWLNNRNILNINLSTWPLSQEEIERAITAAYSNGDPTVQRVINRVQNRLAFTKGPLRVSARTQSSKSAIPQGFSTTKTSGTGLGAAVEFSTETWDINIQGQQEYDQYIDDTARGNLNGSFAGVKVFNQWIAFGEIPQWWGPGYDGSLIRSDAARPVTGLLMQRAEQSPFESPWLSWMGNWQYQLSAGQLRQYQRPEDPKLIGGRLTVNPATPLEVGFSRIMMWGGKGRPNNMSSFWDAFAGHDNTGNQARDPGDQMAGADFNWKLYTLTGIPVSIYGQVIGEDQAGILPSHNTFLAGLQGNHEWGNRQVNWYLEGADTRSGMKETGIIYYHYCYREGYYQQGAPLGDAMGGDGTRYSGKTEIVLENEQRLSTKLMWARVNRTSQSINKTYPSSDTLKGVELGWSLPASNKATIEMGAWYVGYDSQQHNDTGISVSVALSAGGG